MYPTQPGFRVIRVKARRIFTPTRIPGASWVINQYVGCGHACTYCYAKFVSRLKRYGEWGGWVEVKVNAPELVRGVHVKGRVYMSSVSDPYQPVERRLLLTRRVLKSMDKRIELSILTKSDLVLRDLDMLRLFKNLEVGLTINGFTGSVKSVLEPFSPAHERRVEALRALKEAGIANFCFISPVIPGLVDVEQLVVETRGFVDKYWVEMINLRASGRRFRDWLSETLPESYKVAGNSGRLRAYALKIASRLKELNVKVEGVILNPGVKPIKISSSLQGYGLS